MRIAVVVTLRAGRLDIVVQSIILASLLAFFLNLNLNLNLGFYYGIVVSRFSTGKDTEKVLPPESAQSFAALQ